MPTAFAKQNVGSIATCDAVTNKSIAMLNKPDLGYEQTIERTNLVAAMNRYDGSKEARKELQILMHAWVNTFPKLL